MAKNKNKNRAVHKPPVQTAQPSRAEPTAEQLARLASTADQVQALTSERGPVAASGISEPVGPTLEEALKRVQKLLGNAQALFDKALSQEAANKTAAERLATQKRDQDELLRQKQKADEDAVAEARRAAEQHEVDLQARLDAVAQREAAARSKEAEFAEWSARLTEREVNAEQGFLAEKVRVLKPVEDEAQRLRDEREARIAKWADEDEQRRLADAQARRRNDEQMAAERRESLESLRALLASERERAEAALQVELGRRRMLLDVSEADLNRRSQELTDRLKALRTAELDLQVGQELHEEDRAGLARKVARLVAEKSESLHHETEALRKQLDGARADRDAYWRDLESRKELDRRFGDRSPEDILAALLSAETDRDSLAGQLRERPDANSGERLASLERERSAWLEERAVLHGDLAKAQGELSTRRLAAIELEALRKEKEALEVHKQLLDSAVDELRTRVDELTRQEDHRNPMTALTSLDEKESLQAATRTTTPLGKATPTLKEFAVDLRHRIATGVEGRTLYYADRDVRAFLGGLAMTRLMLLQGISGTGKTSLPLAFATAVGGGIEIVEVQAGWRDRQDLIGYYNAFHRHYYATNFLQAIYKAGTPAYRDRLFMMVLDEINLSRPEQFFADFLSALEQPAEERRLTLVNDPVSNAPSLMVDGRHLPIPPNVWFVGTANHDESTAEFADKTYDRAHIMEMPRKTDAAHFAVEERHSRGPLSYEQMEAAFNGAAETHAATVRDATNWLRSASFADDLQRQFRVGWGNRLEHQLARYLPVVVESGGSVGEAMDHLLVTKVFRKLKDRHDVRASALDEFSLKFQTDWEALDQANPPERCVALIESEVAAKRGEELN
ncbi:MAG: hypothetical protein H6716_23560 [Polyangiaceae bacterium]|nr:hypothetical protein [Polyangiaceae bacterium]